MPDEMTPKQARDLHESLGMTLEDLASCLGLKHRSPVTHLERGRTKIQSAKLQLLILLRDTDQTISYRMEFMELIVILLIFLEVLLALLRR